eukprot:1428965-Prymnesium_polylepis.1
MGAVGEREAFGGGDRQYGLRRAEGGRRAKDGRGEPAVANAHTHGADDNERRAAPGEGTAW